MAYVLRFVQRFRPADERAFMALERQFAALERRKRGFPRGRRTRPYAGREPGNTLVWESEFPTLAEAQGALARLAGDPATSGSSSGSCRSSSTRGRRSTRCSTSRRRVR